MKRFKNVTFASAFLIFFAGVSTAWAQQYVFRSIDVPGVGNTNVACNNNAGAIVGYYPVNDLSFSSPFSGIALFRGSFVPVNYPGALSTTPNGISGNGKIVGSYQDSSSKVHGFLLTGKTYTTIDCPSTACPGVVFTALFDVDNSGAIVGYYFNGTAYHGLKLQGGVFTVIDPPGAAGSIANTINNSGQIVGQYSLTDPLLVSDSQGYELIGGSYTPINYPGASYTNAAGINNVGQIVGLYLDSSGGAHGFTDFGGVFSEVDYPGAAETDAFEINDSGQLVGEWASASSVYDRHGFLASPVPGTFAGAHGETSPQGGKTILRNRKP
jgi:hypothetical protein